MARRSVVVCVLGLVLLAAGVAACGDATPGVEGDALERLGDVADVRAGLPLVVFVFTDG